MSFKPPSTVNKSVSYFALAFADHTINFILLDYTSIEIIFGVIDVSALIINTAITATSAFKPNVALTVKYSQELTFSNSFPSVSFLGIKYLLLEGANLKRYLPYTVNTTGTSNALRSILTWTLK